MTTVLVCGGGNAAQVATCLFGTHNKTMALSLYSDEAARWDAEVKAQGYFEVDFQGDNCPVKSVKSVPAMITNDPSVVSTCKVVLFTVPSSFHDQYFKALEPYVQPGTIFGVMPARSGCDFVFQSIFKDKADSLGLVTYETLPWACRISTWGKSATVLGTKETIGAAVKPPRGTTELDVLLKMQGLLGVKPLMIHCPNIMSISLGNPGQVVHPGVTFGQYFHWDGTPYKAKPLFYHGVTDFGEEILQGISDDIQAICHELKSIDPAFNTDQVKTIYQWYMASYSDQVTDASTLRKAMNTCTAYAGLTHPMKETADGYMPDFAFRYLSEDVPTGLCFTKGSAELLCVPTPTIDKVMFWCQEKLGKEFLTSDGKCAGKDLGQTRAPQAFGCTTREQFLKAVGVNGPAGDEHPAAKRAKLAESSS